VQDKQRHRRLRLLIKKLNKKRKKQAKKIDILCNDFIAAQRDFIKSLKTISFIANFYESIIGITDLNSLLYTAVKLIKEGNADANVTFFLRQSDNFELYMFESEQPITLEKQHLENCFNTELMNNICKSNKVCTLDDMFAMGLQGNLIGLNKISGVTIPLGLHSSSFGFVLICRSSENKLTAEEISNISAVTCGLSRAIQCCQAMLRSADKESR
jgi:transcriptional regulator with GAF, ATPase, and Fis domain